MIPASEKPIQAPIVLDTNVCLDLFVFRDPRCAPLLDALERGAVRALTRADCRDEYRLVLHYPHLPLDDTARAGAAARFDALIEVAAPTARALRLPVCTDRDDQKFLEIARDTRAAVLLTKDKALLKLARRTARDGLFLVQTPDAWLKARLEGDAAMPAQAPAAATLE